MLVPGVPYHDSVCVYTVKGSPRSLVNIQRHTELQIIFPVMRTFKIFSLSNIQIYKTGRSHCGAAETNPTSIHEGTGLIPGLAQGSGIAVSYGVNCRHSLDPVLLCLRLWLAAVAQIQAL